MITTGHRNMLWLDPKVGVFFIQSQKSIGSYVLSHIFSVIRGYFIIGNFIGFALNMNLRIMVMPKEKAYLFVFLDQVIFPKVFPGAYENIQ